MNQVEPPTLPDRHGGVWHASLKLTASVHTLLQASQIDPSMQAGSNVPSPEEVVESETVSVSIRLSVDCRRGPKYRIS